MYDKLDNYLSEFADDEFINDYWYDIGFVKAVDIISEFNREDWNILLRELNKKALGWKKRFAYCLGNGDNVDEVSAILLMIDNIDDDELFEICIDSLRNCISSEHISITFKNNIIDRIERMMPYCGKPTQLMFEDIIKKLGKL